MRDDLGSPLARIFLPIIASEMPLGRSGQFALRAAFPSRRGQRFQRALNRTRSGSRRRLIRRMKLASMTQTTRCQLPDSLPFMRNTTCPGSMRPHDNGFGGGVRSDRFRAGNSLGIFSHKFQIINFYKTYVDFLINQPLFLFQQNFKVLCTENGGLCPPNLLLKEIISLRILIGFFLFFTQRKKGKKPCGVSKGYHTL
jgi:hypothetical protein